MTTNVEALHVNWAAMTDQAMQDHIIQVMSSKLGKTDLRPDMTFSGDLKIDSLDLAEFVMAVEEDMGIKIPDQALEKMTTVGSAVTEIAMKLKEKSAS